ncbi:hypothetical protein Bca52824_028203 [Brassica carinata]|uniref:Uncharacterized protein n=1 Tax=Brassica carinata TaxID=52824 RepID=A0A8X8AMJ7_BRACI|nr:hypothetical protein Bca52824_028203 [Brassica carinata]
MYCAIDSEDNRCIVLPSSSEEDYASSCVIGEPPISFVWRINQTSSNILERSASGPLAFFLYTLAPSVIVYVLSLSNALAYKSGSVFHLIHVVVDVRPYLNEAQVTSVTASHGFLFLGRSDGCVSCFKPFLLLRNHHQVD